MDNDATVPILLRVYGFACSETKYIHEFSLLDSVIYCILTFFMYYVKPAWETFIRMKCSYFQRDSSRLYGKLYQSCFL